MNVLLCSSTIGCASPVLRVDADDPQDLVAALVVEEREARGVAGPADVRQSSTAFVKVRR